MKHPYKPLPAQATQPRKNIFRSLKGKLFSLLDAKKTIHIPFAYHFNDHILYSLSMVAEEENRPPQQVAADLLRQALKRRDAADANLRSWQTLSSRQQQVAALVCLNLTNQEIASYLDISPETVKSHVQSILAKFDLHQRAELRLALADWDFSHWAR